MRKKANDCYCIMIKKGKGHFSMLLNKCLQFLKRFYFILIPVGITVIAFLYFHPYYDIGKDDMVLSNMVNSAQTNEHSEYLVFISIYLGYFMRFFALQFPTLNIYEITLVSAYTVAFMAFFYNARQYKNKVLSTVVLASLQVFLLFGITFTIVAFVCCAAGVMLVLENVERFSKKAIKYFIFAFLLIFVGLGYRRGSLATCVFLLFVPTLFFAFKNKRNSLAVVLSVVVIFTGTHQLLKTSQNIYNKVVMGEEYVTFNHYRGIASDGGDLFYEDHKEFFDSQGITETDVKMYNGFRFNDKTMFPVEKVKLLAESLNTENKYLFNFQELMAKSFDNDFLRILLVAGAICLIFLKKNRLEVLADIFFVLGAVIYLHFRKRGINRVVHPIVFIGYIMLLYRFLQNEVAISKRKIAIALRYGVAVAVLFYGFIFPLRDHRNGYYWFLSQEDEKTAKIINHVREDSEYKYVSFASFSSMRNLHFTRQEPIAENLITNVYVGWMVYTPYWYDLLELHGIEEYKDRLYLSLIDSRVKMLCNSSETMGCLEKAIEETYGIQVQRRLGMIRDGRQIYQMWELEREE